MTSVTLPSSMSAARLPHLIIRLCKPIIAIATVATLCAALALGLVGLKEDYRLEAFVATNDQSYERFRAFMEEFTSNEFALVAVHGAAPFGPQAEALLRELVAELRTVPAVQLCSSLTDMPAWLRAGLGDDLLSHPLLAGNLISEDRKTTAILCQMWGESTGGAARRRTVARMKQIVAAARQAHPDFEIVLTGPYVTLIDMYAYVDRDLLVFSVLAFVLTALTLWAVFRRWQPMVFAGAVAAGAILCTLGVTVVLAVVTSLITQMIVILVIVLAVANCVHLAVATDETARALPDAEGRARVTATLGHMLVPCTAVMVTTAAGFASVCISQIAPVRRFGALTALGLLLALLFSFAAVVPLHGRRGALHTQRRQLARLLGACAQSATGHARLWVAVFVVGVALASWGVKWLRFESDFVKNFRAGSEVRRSYRFIERHLSPLGSVEVVVRHPRGESVLSAKAVNAAHEVGAAAVERFAMVKKALTLADPLSLGFANRPTTDEDVRSRLALVRAWPGGARLLRNFTNEAGDALRLNFRCLEGFDVHEKLRACARLRELAADRFGEEYDVEVTGLYHFYAKLVSGLLRDQYRALGLTVAAVFVVIWILLRSLKLALVVMVINLLPVVVCLGAMGWSDVPVNMTTAMMLSVTLGIAVDDTLHYVWRLRRELAHCGEYREAIRRTHDSVGKACVFTTVVITGGFSILLLSRFLPTAYFGGLVGFTMLAALAADLLLLPAMIVLFRPLGAERV